MKLKRLLKDIPIEKNWGPKDVEVTGVCADSKRVAPGNLFVAKKGKRYHGSVFIGEAAAAGAAAVLTDIYDPNFTEIAQVIYPKVCEIEGLIAARYHLHPSSELFMVGITGTNGKTTTSYLIKHLLDTMGGRSGLIGTIEYLIGDHRYQPTHTTPDVTMNHRMLHEMVLQQCDAAVMEVTSHALHQGRVSQIQFDIAVFTNLSLEHLDYHGTMENYCDAKNLLFRGLEATMRGKKGRFPKAAVVNGDDPWHREIVKGCKVPVVRYGIDSPCELQASNIRFSPEGTSFNLSYRGKTVNFSWPYVGRFNIYNGMAAIAVGLLKGGSLFDIASTIRSFPPVPGRLQPVPNAMGLKIYVDFAHTDDALRNVLQSLSELKQGRIITIFGGGGDRDRSKRPKMAAAAEAFSDLCIVTSDNPRSEDPLQICNDIATGFQREYIIEPDRQEAIKKAIKMAEKEDIILIAGKGHEKFQIFAHNTVEFDDCKVAADICSSKIKG